MSADRETRLARLRAERDQLLQRVNSLKPNSQARTVALHNLTRATAAVLNAETKLIRSMKNEHRAGN